MTLKSMTGFARADGAAGPTRWHWELRSVNGRGLDLRLKLAPGYEALEPRVREAAAKRLKRGNVAISLAVKREEGAEIGRASCRERAEGPGGGGAEKGK